MKLGIFGGTFDPFTLAHREIVKHVLEKSIVDRVVIAPTIVTWHREGKKPWLTDEQRLQVIKEIISNDDFNCYVSIYDRDIIKKSICSGNDELKKRFIEPHRFIDTLIDIKMSYEESCGEDCELYPIIGNDSWASFKTWSNWREIAALSQQILVVNGRDGFPRFEANPDVPNATWISIDSSFASVSSTAVREQFTSVENYIACMLDQLKHEQRETLLRTPIFDVIRGEETSTGLKPILIDAPDWIMIVVERKGKFLVEKQLRYGSKCDTEEFPCGMVERGEDPLDTAVRELEEETGFKIEDKSQVVKLGQMNPNPAFMTNTMHLFYVNLDNAKHKKTKLSLDTHEKITFKFVDKHRFENDVVKHVIKGSHVPAMLLSALMMHRRHCSCIKDILKKDEK